MVPIDTLDAPVLISVVGPVLLHTVFEYRDIFSR